MTDLTSASAFQEQFRALRVGYANRIGERLANIDTAWQALQESGWDSEQIEALHRLAHSIAGSGSTFGFNALSDSARRFELALGNFRNLESPPPDDQIHHLESSLQDLKRIAQQTIEGVQAAVHIAPLVSVEDGGEIDLIKAGQFRPDPAGKLIYLFDDEEEFSKDLAMQIGHFGYTVQTFSNLDQLEPALAENRPSAVVLDVVFPESSVAGIDIANNLLPPGSGVPVVFISLRKDMEARLRAVRAGGEAYFAKPVDVNALIDTLDTLTSPQAHEPYRILIVDDEVELANYHAAILKRAGMATTVINNPMLVPNQLAEYRPDLILMDVYMPSCTGLELAKVIRQQEDYVSIPIVFFSTETNLEKQMQAMNLGGDDFLTKPIEPDHLVAAVTTRAQRSRVLRSLMMRDSLTGLLNHTATREQLEIEMARARRNGTGLALAMLDIDRFKNVNDTHGHPAGDRVIKSLARMLQQRLRRVDIVGRYGGEEFAVVLTGTDGPSALRVMDRIRNDFALIRQYAEGNEFFVTFSCGIAAFPDFSEATALGDAADQALYRAKREGRNRTVYVSA